MLLKSFVPKSVKVQRRVGRGALQVTNVLAVRPYTVRKGDTLSSICEKRGFELKDVVNLNYGLDADLIVEGQTILLPASNLSTRDKEILGGIGPKTYRTYPVRKGESIEDIISPRKITMQEVEALNPEVNLKALIEHQVIKLPANKYTLREREMLMGVAGAPESYFAQPSPWTHVPFLAAGMAAGGLATYFFLKRGDDDHSDHSTKQ